MDTEAEELIVPRTKAQETQELVAQASKLVVRDGETYKLADQLRRRCKEFVDYFEGLYRPRVDEAWKLHGNLLADLKKLKGPPETQFKRLGQELSEFDRRAEEEKRRLEREAERKRQEEQAEQQRLANLAEELGAPSYAEEMLDRPVDPGPVIKKNIPEVEGLHYRHGGWGFKITDSQQIADEFWMLDTQKVQQIVSRLGKQAERIVGGIEVFERPKIPVQR